MTPVFVRRMLRKTKVTRRSVLLGLIGLIAGLLPACAYSLSEGTEVASMPALAGVTRRQQMQRPRSGPVASTQPAAQTGTTQPAGAFAATSRPSVVLGAVANRSPSDKPDPSGHGPTSAPASAPAEPVALRIETIVQRVFDTSPLMRASREEMTAAEYALQEFRTNLSRLEPYINSKGESAAYPDRLDARGSAGESVVGIQKETFEGAIMRVEGGAGASAFTYDDADREDRVDRGSGGLVRARLEVPFIGSRKRQERVISQAFQESQARKARLEYLSDFRIHATDALEYYLLALLNQDYAQICEQQAQIIEGLLKQPGLKEEDRFRLTSTMESSRVTRDQYLTSRHTYVLLLMALVGLPMETSFNLVERPDQPSQYLVQLSTSEGRAATLDAAYANNPRFRVLKDAINDAELQRRQAIAGRFDITAYLEGTQFPFGAVTYDDRVGGWLVGGGVNVRLNDHRVLTASRLKAEAQIRQFQAEIEAERLSIERNIVDNSEKLQSYHRIREEAAQIARKKESEFRRRSTIYFEGSDPTLTIDNVLGPLTDWIVAENRLAANKYYIGLADLQIMTATGELYRMVGMDIDSLGAAQDPQQAAPAQE